MILGAFCVYQLRKNRLKQYIKEYQQNMMINEDSFEITAFDNPYYTTTKCKKKRGNKPDIYVIEKNSEQKQQTSTANQQNNEKTLEQKKQELPKLPNFLMPRTSKSCG